MLPGFSLTYCREANLQAHLRWEKVKGAGGVWFLGSGALAVPEPQHSNGANPPILTSDGAGCKCTGAEVLERSVGWKLLNTVFFWDKIRYLAFFSPGKN